MTTDATKLLRLEYPQGELETARLGAGADLVYLIDAARQHLEAAEELVSAAGDPHDLEPMRCKVGSLIVQVDAMRQLHRTHLDDFMRDKPGPAERRAIYELQQLLGR